MGSLSFVLGGGVTSLRGRKHERHLDSPGIRDNIRSHIAQSECARSGGTPGDAPRVRNQRSAPHFLSQGHLNSPKSIRLFRPSIVIECSAVVRVLKTSSSGSSPAVDLAICFDTLNATATIPSTSQTLVPLVKLEWTHPRV